jgi:hypothetical protein
MAAAASPKAIILYSFASASCNLTAPYSYGSIWTMTNVGDAQVLMRTIAAAQVPLQGTLALANATNNESTSANSDTNTQAPTTAVAMSILYSITGIITLLFLAIIATGAVRAHRHPERYGPRGGTAGRPRQSRARGLARAMLETIPIVKFGDPEPDKPGSRDIELEDGNATIPKPEEVTITTTTATAEGVEATPAAAGLPASEREMPPAYQNIPVESGLGPDVSAREENQLSDEQNAGSGTVPEHLGCSICTEDFVAGEDVRVLPCKHKFHPACIDPWLLNVSGTCPLWYVYLFYSCTLVKKRLSSTSARNFHFLAVCT